MTAFASGQYGRIDVFDVDAGLGWLDAADGSRFRFHCTAIVDGTRTIDEGQAVSFVIGPAGPGHWEALAVSPIP